ncbi:MAG: hypothetical protein K0A89_11835 [ANME-2 cluster archaeon]|nr:hypothetical protein [ANME-2 cluster archaeon]
MRTSKTGKWSDFPARLDGARTLADIFELVKEIVWNRRMKSRAGLMLGLADMGNSPEGFVGAFFTVGSNFIVMNRIPLERIKETRPELYKPFAFHVLMHEYIHSLGYLDEQLVRQMVYDISSAVLGESHLATQLAQDPTRFIPNLAYPDLAWRPKDLRMELVQGFDRGSVCYIN